MKIIMRGDDSANMSSFNEVKRESNQKRHMWYGAGSVQKRGIPEIFLESFKS